MENKVSQVHPKQNFSKGIEGLRCLACLLVVAGHCNMMGLRGHGGVPVAFFFALSGFLLAAPWEKDGEEKYLSWKYLLKNYYLKKAARLLPPYYIILFGHAYLQNSFQVLEGDLFFTNSSGHYWYIQQYFVMLLVAPLIILAICVLKSIIHMNNYLVALILLIGAYCFKTYVTSNVFSLMGNGKRQEFRMALFLVGMAFGYLKKGIGDKRIQNRGCKLLLDLLAVIILGLALFSAPRFLGMIRPEWTGYQVGWNKPFECAVVSGILILCVSINYDGLLSRILGNPIFVFIGSMSYVVYLVHFILLGYVPGTTASRLFARIMLLSLGIGMLIKEFIEKPIEKIIRKL